VSFVLSSPSPLSAIVCSLLKQSIAGAGSSSPVPFLLATESCNCPGVADGTQALFEDVGKGWQRGERLMRDSLSDLNHYSVGYVDWNLLVDYNGGEFLWCGGVYCLWLLVCVVCTGFTTDRENSLKSFLLLNDTINNTNRIKLFCVCSLNFSLQCWNYPE
jgi:hypothetical protein